MTKYTVVENFKLLKGKYQKIKERNNKINRHFRSSSSIELDFDLLGNPYYNTTLQNPQKVMPSPYSYINEESPKNVISFGFICEVY